MLIYLKEILVVNKTSEGYLYFIDKEHPLAVGNSGKVYLHRHLASIKLGRWLNSTEHVHHIDGNKENNIDSNLQILSASEHSLIHKPNTCAYIKCEICGNSFLQKEARVKYCSIECGHKSIIKDKSLSKDLLDSLIPLYSWVQLGKLFGYSDSGIKKRAKALGCTIPIRRKIAS